MSFAKLTTKEIEHRIDQFRVRTETLKEIIKDVKDPSAKKTLESHSKEYQTTIELLRKELEKRNSK
jgi:hypothetical protein